MSRRSLGATVVSLFAHGALVALAILLLARHAAAPIAAPVQPVKMVYLAAPGSAGGGGGGRPAPAPARLQAAPPKPAPAIVPVPEPVPEPVPLQPSLTVSIERTTDLFTTLGALQGFPTAGLGNVPGTGLGPGPGAGPGPGCCGGLRGYGPGDGATMPVRLAEVKPNYTPAAMQSKVQGEVWLDAVVLPDGTVGDVTIARSLERGLDQEAIAAAKRTKFLPGRKDGVPVPVIVRLIMAFTLRQPWY